MRHADKALSFMIYGIGIDMVKVTRVESVIARWGDRFLERVFTSPEIIYSRDKADAASRFALRFAAKEAFSKAIGTGFRNGLSLRHIEVLRSDTGAPRLALRKKAEVLCRRCGIKNTFLSLADDGGYAVAVVVLEA
jgi:holo-[acyl-carrier protein] synthase